MRQSEEHGGQQQGLSFAYHGQQLWQQRGPVGEVFGEGVHPGEEQHGGKEEEIVESIAERHVPPG